MRLLEKIALLKWESYTEKYFFNIEDLYLIYDAQVATNKPSKWEIATTNLKKHDMGFVQKSKIETQMMPATKMILKYKFWADFKIHFAYRMMDEGDSGVVFRFVDSYNYYWLTIKPGKYIFGRMFDGIPTIIEEAGNQFMQDQWVRFLITGSQFFFKVYSYVETDPSDEVMLDESKLTVEIAFEDHYLARGYMGWFTNKSKGTCFDMISYIPREVVQ